MSLSCEKEIAINVKGSSLMYWSFDNVSGGSFIDNSLGVPFTPTGTNTIAALIGNGSQFQAAFSRMDANLTVAPKPANYNLGGISHAFWARMDVKVGNFPTEIVATVMNGDDGHQYEFSFRPGLGGNLDNIPFELIQDPSFLGPTVLTVTVPIVWVAGSWNFFAFIYNQSTGKLSVSVNNGVPNVSAGSFTLPTGNWNDLHPSASFVGAWPTITIDEYMIHTGKSLNATQITNLYNGGAGVTWPAAGAIVS